MSRFHTPTDVRVLRGKAKEGRQLFELLAPVVYESDLLGEKVIVPRGYITDFASVPKLPLAWLVAGGTAHEAAVVHDWLYTTQKVMGKPIDRATADAVFREAILVSEDKNAPAGLMWLAVRLGGGGPWKDTAPAQPVAVRDFIDAGA